MQRPSSYPVFIVPRAKSSAFPAALWAERFALSVLPSACVFMTPVAEPRYAAIVRVPGGAEAAVEALASDGANAYGENAHFLHGVVARLPVGARVLQGRFNVVRMAIAVPKGRGAAGLDHLGRCVAEAKRDGTGTLHGSEPRLCASRGAERSGVDPERRLRGDEGERIFEVEARAERAGGAPCAAAAPVSITPRGPRSMSRAPNSSSSGASYWLRAGCATRSRAAAAEMLPAWAMPRK
jgi:hypothetical protein